jgi:hypothetical protein
LSVCHLRMKNLASEVKKFSDAHPCIQQIEWPPQPEQILQEAFDLGVVASFGRLIPSTVIRAFPWSVVISVTHCHGDVPLQFCVFQWHVKCSREPVAPLARCLSRGPRHHERGQRDRRLHNGGQTTTVSGRQAAIIMKEQHYSRYKCKCLCQFRSRRRLGHRILRYSSR